jgi:LacI family transcriptional regulator
VSVTIKQIAHLAGLSVPTVSRILNNDSELFRPETREKVLQAARELGYRPNSYRMALRTKRFNAIGLLLGSAQVDGVVSGSLMRALLGDLHSRNQHLLVGQISDDASQPESAAPKMLREWSVDGMLMLCDGAPPLAVEKLIGDNKIPAIWLGARRPSDCIYSDDEGGAREATQRLLKIGHKKIAFVSLGGDADARAAHQAGYESAMKDEAMPRQLIAPKQPVPQAVRFDYLSDWLRTHQKESPTAVLCAGRSEAVAFFAAALAAGKSVPQDVSIIAIHGEPVEDAGQRITTMVLPGSEMALQGLAALAEKISHPERDSPSRALPMVYAEGATLAPPGGV